MECGVGFWAVQSSCTTVWYHEKNHLNTAHDGATRRRLLSTSTAVPTSNHDARTAERKCRTLRLVV